MKLYKGFDKDLRCRDFQYKEGETYEEKHAILCKSGFHACENPMDCFNYYAPGTSRYHEVELDVVAGETSDDTKRVGKKITIGAEIGFCLKILAKMCRRRGGAYEPLTKHMQH